MAAALLRCVHTPLARQLLPPYTPSTHDGALVLHDLLVYGAPYYTPQAIAAWRLASEPERLWICGAYVHYTGALLSSECIRHVL